jgi:adenylate cyclase
VIDIGLTRLTFVAGRENGAEPPREPDCQNIVAASPPTVYRGADDLLVGARPGGPACPAGTARDPRQPLSPERANKVLFVLYEISRQLHAMQDFNALLRTILDLVFAVVDADCGCILLADGQNLQDLVPVVVKHRDARSQALRPVQLSRTIVETVVRDRVALLTSNAMDDARFGSAASIYGHQMRSVLCVPLWKKDTVIGVLQLDSVRAGTQFTNGDLELLKAIGSQVSMVIEQANLNEHIRREEQARRQLERFHSPQVVEMILRGGAQAPGGMIEPRELTATVLFADIIGFTSLAERMPARAVTAILNRYFSRMTDIVFAHDGTLDKYIGDGLMAVFGAPIEKDDDAVRAIRAARDMRAALGALRCDAGEPLAIHIRIGLNTGRVVAGNIGSPRRLEYTVIGDPVNTASRIENLAQPDQILIGEETCRRVKDVCDVRAVGLRRLKGKAADVMVYEVL